MALLLACGLAGIGIGIWSVASKDQTPEQLDVGAKIVNGDAEILLVENDETSWTYGLQIEYKALGIEFEQGDTLMFKFDGKPLRIYIDSASSGLDMSVTDRPLDELEVTESGIFDVYLKHWDSGSWTVYACRYENAPEQD